MFSINTAGNTIRACQCFLLLPLVYPGAAKAQKACPHANISYLQYFPTLKAPTRGPCCVLQTSRIPLLGA